MNEPRDVYLEANRLRLHLLEWGAGDRVVLLLHGYLEHAHGWDFVAPRLAAAGYHVFALDWRGHGDSEWIGRGGYYHFLDYIADLSCLVPQLGERVAVVGHSMGGGAAVLYAGTEPERVWALALIEGIGVPDSDPADVPQRVVAWLGDLRRVAATPPRRVLSEETAARRIASNFTSMPPAMASHLVRHNLRLDGESGLRWKFDPLHQTRSPQPTYVAQARAFWQRIDCPVLYVQGSESQLRLSEADLEERVAAMRGRRWTIAGAAHHPQLETPEELAGALSEFLAHAATSLL